jgi:PKD repeat protein
MATNEVKGYENPNYDKRVKSVMQIDNIFMLLKRLATLTGLGLLLGLLLANITKAQSIPDMFMVPVVRLTSYGATVMQPQTGDGYENSGEGNVVRGLTQPSNNTGNTGAGLSGNLDDGSNYRPPQYDAFAEGSMDQPVNLPEPVIKNLDTVDFKIRNNIPGSGDQSLGTTNSTFTFTADVTSKYYQSGGLEYRWDFENDGITNTYFSVVKSATHLYRTPGQYQVKLEVLDGKGQVSSVVKTVYVAANDAPFALFKVDKINAPVNSIFRFDTSFSSDNQYAKGQLAYRFDWDNDGKYDTNFQNKTVWNHLFRDPGNYNVIMEVKDPESATAKAEISIYVSDDSPPDASLSVEKTGDFKFNFDASQSSDDYTPLNRLKFRWDFNYNGVDDIIFDSGWNYSPKQSGSYKIGGSKMIRLQVMDEQGLIDETFAQIEVPWPEEYLSLFANML